MAQSGGDVVAVGFGMAGAAGIDCHDPRAGSRADTAGRVLFQARGGHLRRRLCGAGLHGAGGGGDQGLAQRAGNDRWIGTGRDDTGAADPRHGVRRLFRRASRHGFRLGRHRGRSGDAVGYLRAVFPVDIRRSALHRGDRQAAETVGRSGRHHRRSGGRDPESVTLVNCGNL